MDLQRLIAILCAALFIPGVFCARGESSLPPMSVHEAANSLATLVVARLDVARLAGVEPIEVTLINIQSAEWDGCLGIRRPGQACTAIAVDGVIARFEAGGHSYRYHIAGDRYLGPVDPANADDGGKPGATTALDTEAGLAYYARADLALRQGIDPSDVVVEAALPGMCGPGESLPNVSCPAAGAYHATLRLAVNGEQSLYKIVSDGTVQRLAPLNGPMLDDTSIDTLQQRMRSDLADRLSIKPGDISILSYVRVQWPDACLGIEQRGQVCAQAVTPGFAATLLASPGNGQTEKLYTYRGAGDHFIAADFVPMATIAPVPGGQP